MLITNEDNIELMDRYRYGFKRERDRV